MTESDVPETEGVLLLSLFLKTVEARLEWLLLSDQFLSGVYGSCDV